jgi:hypothetical protein
MMAKIGDASAIYVGLSSVSKAYYGSSLAWSPTEEGGEGAAPEWLAWDYDPFNPLLDEFLLTQVFS